MNRLYPFFRLCCFSSVQSLSRMWLFATPWITARQASLSITNSQSLLKLMPIELVMPSSHLILYLPFSSCPQSLPASGSFPMSQLFPSGGQSIGVSISASVFPMITQDWSPSAWTGWVSLQFKGLSRVFSNTTVQKHQFLGTQLSSQSNSHKTIALTRRTSVGKVMSLLFNMLSRLVITLLRRRNVSWLSNLTQWLSSSSCLWFWFSFLQQIIILSNFFSDVYWSFIYQLLKMYFQILCPFKTLKTF